MRGKKRTERGATAFEYLMVTVTVAAVGIPLINKHFGGFLGGLRENRQTMVNFIAQNSRRPVPNKWFSTERPPSPDPNANGPPPGGPPPPPGGGPPPGGPPPPRGNPGGPPPLPNLAPDPDGNPTRSSESEGSQDKNPGGRTTAEGDGERPPTDEAFVPPLVAANEAEGEARSRSRRGSGSAENGGGSEGESDGTGSLSKRIESATGELGSKSRTESALMRKAGLQSAVAAQEEDHSRGGYSWWRLLRLLILVMIIILFLWLVLTQLRSLKR